MHLPNASLSKDARARLKQAKQEAARWFQYNGRAQHAYVSLAQHLEGQAHATELLARLRNQPRRSNGAQEFTRRRELDSAAHRCNKANREVEYARGLLLHAIRSPGPAPRNVPPPPKPRRSATLSHREPMWIGSHWTRSTS